MVNAKKKGNAGENKFANWLLSHGIKAGRDSASGGGLAKGDIHNDLDLTIEVKTVKGIGLKEAWRQVDGDAALARNAPLLAIHFDGMPENTWLIVQHSNDWIEQIKGEHTAPTPYTDPRVLRAAQTAVDGMKRFINLIEN